MSNSNGRINEKLPVELLQTLVMFVDTSRHRNFKPHNSASLDNVGAVVVTRQFDLRYVCLLWHNIVHRLARLALHYCSDYNEFSLFNSCPIKKLSETRKGTGPPRRSFPSTKKNRKGEWYTLADSIGSLRVDVQMKDKQINENSVFLALRNAASGIDHSCDLRLHLSEWAVDGDVNLVSDPHADFEQLYPTLSLCDLSLNFATTRRGVAETAEDRITRVSQFTHFCFSIGQQSLRSVDVQLSVLAVLPEDWVCESVQDLQLHLQPVGYEWIEAPWSEEKMLQEFNKQAIVPRMFPRLKRITLSVCSWPHIDFANLNQLTVLESVTLDVHVSPRKTTDWRVAALPRVQSLYLVHYDFKFPVPLGEFVPNLTNLKVDVEVADGCSRLLNEINATKNCFAKLSHLSVNFDLYMERAYVPPLEDAIALVTAICQLPALSWLEFAGTKVGLEWCRPGDFTLLQVLPRGLTSASLLYCFAPAAVLVVADHVTFVCEPNVAGAEELIYENWFRTAIRLLSEFPKLERFYCKISAPSFHAAVSLASKWSKSSAAAIADLGIASVVHVSCSTDAYLTIEPCQTYDRHDCLKFRFTLGPRPDLVDRKFSKRIFTFELEYPTKPWSADYDDDDYTYDYDYTYDSDYSYTYD